MSATCRRCGLRWAAPYSADTCCKTPIDWEPIKESVGFAALAVVVVVNLVLWSIVFQP